ISLVGVTEQPCTALSGAPCITAFRPSTVVHDDDLVARSRRRPRLRAGSAELAPSAAERDRAPGPVSRRSSSRARVLPPSLSQRSSAVRSTVVLATALSLTGFH